MNTRYLIHGTNALKGGIRYADPDTFQYDRESARKFFAAACATLSELVADKPALDVISRGINGSITETYSQFGDFVNEFVKPDKALLVAAGMDPRMVQYLFQDLDDIHGLIRGERSEDRDISSEELEGRIEGLRDVVCAEKDAVKTSPSMLRRTMFAVGGAAVITTNWAGDAVIGGLASNFSMAYGGHLVGKGLEGLPF